MGIFAIIFMLNNIQAIKIMVSFLYVLHKEEIEEYD